uniref:Heparan sulfate proteoglycan 2 n=1 Tax=Terrapene triunguis TaxID=2587831 RepID=A0A674KBM4_9SAUR
MSHWEGGAVLLGAVLGAQWGALSHHSQCYWFSWLSCLLLSRWPSLLSACPVYFRALVNFTQSIDYNPRLDDANSEEFREVSEAVVDTLESEYYKIGGEQVVSVVFIKEIDGYTFVELDVGSEGNLDEGEIREVLYSVIESGSIASYITSTQGFQFRRLGAVAPEVRACTGEEFACTSGECIDKEFRCDRRPDCRDMSDEQNCGRGGSSFPKAGSHSCLFCRPWLPHLPVRHPLEQRPCRRDEAVCSNKQCIPRDYLCDGERDCLDGSDELSCGTPTPCEPNEFKCRNGHCALKLWRCDGDNDCVDGSDEVDCPTKGPDDTCSPDQFTCVSSRTCIPASYQCDEEADCPDRSDEVGCTPPQVITPPEESVQATPGQTVRFRCVAVGVPTPIITWRLNWGHIPANRRVSISSENGYGTLTIRDVKEADQGAYTCEAINARGMVFGIPDGVLSLMPRHGPCPEGHFHVEGTSRCLACFCFGITTACHGTSRYRDQIRLRFDTPDDFKGVNVTTPAQPGTLPLSSTQLQIDPTLQEFQLVDLSRRFLAHDSFWTLPSQFLGNKVDSYGGYLSFKVRYGLARGQSEPVQKSNVVIVGNGQKLIYRVQVPTQPSVVNQRQIHFIEENWQHESGAPVSRETLLLALQNLESILVQTVYDNKMASVGLSDIAMDTTTMELTSQGVAQGVEECRCPIGYSGLSCERCDARFERVREGPYLGTCSGCNCHGHSSSCDRAFGYCLNCQHNTEGPQCNKCKPGFFGDATRGNATACRSCPCPYTDSTRRFSDTCFLDTDGQATCDACAQGYTGRRCERWVPEALVEQGGCQEFMKCDERGSSDSTGGACRCKPNVAGRLCNECTSGAFYLSDQNPDGCLKCFCMGVSRQCTSSSWNREQVPPAGSTSPPPRAPPGSTSPAQRPPSEQWGLLLTPHYGDGVPGALPSSCTLGACAPGTPALTAPLLCLQSRSERTDIATLVIPSITAADSGVYLCIGTSPAGVGSPLICAKLIYPVLSLPASGMPPPIRIEASSSSIAEGQTLDLNCLVTGQAPATVTWYKRGGSLPARHQVSGSHLRISQVSAADSGEYVCRVSIGASSREASIPVTVQHSAGSPHAPPIHIESSSSAGQTLDLHCLVMGQALATVTWYKRGGSLPASRQLSGSHLRLVQVSAADSGEYVCRAGTKEASVIVTIQQTSGVTPPVRIESSSSSVAEGQTLDLNCLVAGQVQPRVTWHKRGGSLPASHQVSGSRLRIPQVSVADSGEYICRVSNGAGPLEASVIVTIPRSAGSSYPSGMVPPIRIESSSSSIAEGQTLDLNCLVAGQAPATVTWYKRGGSLLASHQVSGSRLRLLQVSAADSGEYVCRVSTSAGPREASITVSVPSGTSSSYRLQSPIISIEPHSTAVRQDEDATFKCRIHGGARPINITWKMAPKQQLQDNVKISPNGSVITISRARPSNQGAYRCVASNRYGVANSVVNLMVQGSPTVSVMPKGPVTVKAGKSISLDCLGMGDPRPLVRWSRLGMRQKMEHQKLLPLESQAVLQISAAKPEDAGTYICMAQNSIGSAQVQVEVSVEAAHGKPGAPEITVKPTLTVVAGETATLQCSAIGDPPPTIQWSKLRAPLPWQHRVVNNTLLIPRVAQQDSGQYICNASNAAGFTEAFITLDVETPPYATSLPEEVSVSAGEAVQLQCLAHGTPPLHYQWSKANGSLSSNAVLRESALHIRPTVPEDSGTYRCLVSNRVGSAETFAQVSVQGSAPSASPTVRVTPQTDVKGVGGTAEFTCSVTGDARARIEWFREDGELPASHSVRNGVLRIQNLDRGCQGVYTCRVSSPSGQAQDSARLVIQALPKVMINVRTSVQSVLVGAAVEFECLAIGDPKAHITWSKVGSRIRPEVVVSGGMVKIERVEQSDAGQYRCTATNDVGTVQSNVILHVQSIPQIAAQPEVKEVTMGSRAVFPCLASGFPVPEIKWTKLEGDLPKDICLENNVLTIPSVKPEDAGIYVCTASNRQGKVTTFSMLKVRERVVPYFTQNPQTFLALPTIKDAYKKFEIQITFRPDTADGMLLYNGQKKSTGADFVSFGLVGGRPEFRFDAGSGMATIRHPAPIRLGEFHTVRLYRNLTQGSLVLDSHPPVNGTSQGKFQGLDLNEELYLGGYPDYIAVAKSGLSSGFVGCVRQLLVQGEEVIFKDLDLKAHGVSNCPTCRDRPCQNGGVCRDSESSSYVCHCPQEFTGKACGPDATCINRADGQGYRCRCHLGKSGETCMEGVMATTPSFSGSDSFISYPPLTNIHYELRLEAEFKPLSPDGLILFSGGSGAPVEDFVSLAVASGHVEFRYELGSGMAVLRSTEPLALGQWHKVSAERINKDGTLQVDSSKPVKRSSPGKSQGLNLRTPMYLGGVDKSITLPAAASISSSFHGCIGEVSINGKKVDISYSFLESRGITQCYDSSPCDRRPCLHGATCMPTGEYEFQCLCQDGFRGGRCELAEDQCLLRNPCLNGGKCKANKCLCPAGFSGTYCEQGMGRGGSQHPLLSDPSSRPADAPGQYGAYFQDGGYLALPRHVLPRSHPKSPETIELEVRTRSPNGLLLWQGVVSRAGAKDFISLGLRDGHLVFSYQLGSGEASIVSEDPINDGEWHRVTAVREGRRGSIQVDGEELVSGESPGSNVMVNTQGNVYIGGAPAIQALTAGKFRSGITGCIKNLVLSSERPGQPPRQPIDLQHHSEAGVNMQECPS